MKSYLGLLIALLATNNSLFAAEAGMPQLDPRLIGRLKLFWLILVFCNFIYYQYQNFICQKLKTILIIEKIR